MTYRVDFEPLGRRAGCSGAESLLDLARQVGIDLVAVCGGRGSCGRCRIQVLAGSVSAPTDVETRKLTKSELEEGYRLACRTYPRGDIKVYVPESSLNTRQRTQVEGLLASIPPNPTVRSYDVSLSAPSLADLTADAERLRRALWSQHGVECNSTDIDVLRGLSAKLRAAQWRTRVAVRGQEIVAVMPLQARPLGLAFDVGTTKIAGYLLDLNTGQTLTSKGAMNPQIAYGEDIITRLTSAHDNRAQARGMQEDAIGALNKLMGDMCEEVGVETSDILEAVIVANTAIHHLLLGLPTSQLLMAPYLATVSGGLDIKARDLGRDVSQEVNLNIAPGAYVHVLPNIAGYVGADHVAMILATEVWKSQGLVLALDIGTNTEICLAADGRMSSVSAASGPAFEGAHIKHGMRAAPGAIEHVHINDGEVEYQTVDGAEPAGICGSGIVDAIAQMYLNGILDRGGAMVNHPQVRKGAGGAEFVLAHGPAGDITITQRDVREVQLAKAAIRAGIATLLKDAGRTEEEIDEVIIAGAFGSYINTDSAVAIGLLPALASGRFRQVGNAAGAGARLALISAEQRQRAEDIAGMVRYIELASTPGFVNMFSKAIYLGQDHKRQS